MRAWYLVLCILLGITLDRATCFGGGGPKNVLLVINENSPVSQSIGSYYQQKRGVPDCNVCRIRCSTNELVTKDECETNIVTPIRSFIDSSSLHDKIDYIVLTKGIPLGASYNDSSWYGPASVASVLTCVGETSVTAPVTNPYGPVASPLAPVQYFTHQSSFSGHSYYIVTRLDAYTEGQAKRMIDDALIAKPVPGLFLLDGRYESQQWSQYYIANDRLRKANHNLHAAGYATYYDDVTFDSLIRDFAGGLEGIMGYFSWGSNESSYTLQKYTSNRFVPGSIADGYVSFSGRSFAYPPSYGQSLIADLIPQGLSAGTGYVSEPQISLQSYPNVLFDRYILGYNMGESFFAATPRLYWKAVTVGDPLMAPYATPPKVKISYPDPAYPVQGTVVVSASASDASGINKMEFYVDDKLVSTSFVPPYQFEWNTKIAGDGLHKIEAIAYENTSVYTQGMASIQARVCNAPVDAASISQLSTIPDGTLVRLPAKVIIAGTDAFTDCAYLAESSRSSGIRLQGSFEVATGATVTVEGVLGTMNGERVINVNSLTPLNLVRAMQQENTALKPLAMPNRFLANTGRNVGPESSGLIGGLSNVSLLVTTWGRVTGVGGDGFWMSDGSLERKRAIINEVAVSLLNMTSFIPEAPPIDSYVMVTGISCYTMENGLLRPTIRPRFPSDIVVMNK